jgi:hypothetical protein
MQAIRGCSFPDDEKERIKIGLVKAMSHAQVLRTKWSVGHRPWNEEGHARASIQSCPEKPSKHLWPFSVASRGCFVSFGAT